MRTFWEPVGQRRWEKRRYEAKYGNWMSDEASHFTKTFPSGMEREQFIREQNSLIRKFKSNDEYVAFYKTVLTLTA